MPILRSKVNPDILRQNCHRCAVPVPQSQEPVLSFAGGKFVIYHKACFDAEIEEMERAAFRIRRNDGRPVPLAE